MIRKERLHECTTRDEKLIYRGTGYFYLLVLYVVLNISIGDNHGIGQKYYEREKSYREEKIIYCGTGYLYLLVRSTTRCAY